MLKKIHLSETLELSNEQTGAKQEKKSIIGKISAELTLWTGQSLT